LSLLFELEEGRNSGGGNWLLFCCSRGGGSSELLNALDREPDRSSPLPDRSELTPESERSSGKRSKAVAEESTSILLKGEDEDRGPSSSS
jgi:hypothetical protein